MNFLLQRLSDPEIEPVTLAEAKRHIRAFANVTSEDDDIDMLVKVAREWVEDYTGRVLVDQSWRLTIRKQPFQLSGNSVAGYLAPGYEGSVYCGQLQSTTLSGVHLRKSPAIEITRLVKLDSQGAETLVDDSEYILVDAGTRWPRVLPLTGASWTGGDFMVEYRAGFANRSDSPVTGAEVIPARLKHAIKLIIGNYDSNRDLVNIGNIVTKLPLSLEWLLQSEKCELGMA